MQSFQPTHLVQSRRTRRRAGRRRESWRQWVSQTTRLSRWKTIWTKLHPFPCWFCTGWVRDSTWTCEYQIANTGLFLTHSSFSLHFLLFDQLEQLSWCKQCQKTDWRWIDWFVHKVNSNICQHVQRLLKYLLLCKGVHSCHWKPILINCWMQTLGLCKTQYIQEIC